MPRPGLDPGRNSPYTWGEPIGLPRNIDGGVLVPLQLTTSSPQELSPEDLAPFKETLLAYLRLHAETRQQVDSNLHITVGEKIPLYTFTLQVLLESRGPKPENVTKALRQVP